MSQSSDGKSIRLSRLRATGRAYVRNRYLVAMLIPGVVFFVVFKYLPIYGVQIAFKEYRFLQGIWRSPWIGLENFRYLFAAKSFWNVFRNTLEISLLHLVFGFPAPIVLALLFNEVRHLRFKKTIQTISYLPHFISWVILGGLFMQFLSPSVGPVNLLLKELGGDPIFFLADPKWFRTVLVTTQIWKGVGWGSIIYLAALSNVDPQLYDAADIDGANRLQKIRYITLPSLSPVITIMLILVVGTIVEDNFDQIFNLYNPAVYSVGDVLSTYTYRMGLVNLEYGFSAAVGLFTNVIAFMLVVIANSLSKRINSYGIW